ncbi:MAG: RHS repeat-associated core domain-containing protein [Phycisphaerae bacterium]
MLAARYYDPLIGRFLQRDPIGIRGGLNVYAYVRNAPTIRIDPDGLHGEVWEPDAPPVPPSYRPPVPPRRPRPPKPETPQQELRRIRRRLALTAAAYAGCAALTWWFPPAAVTFGAGAAGAAAGAVWY